MKVVVLDVLFVSSFMTLKCLLYHSNQGVLAYEKAVLKYSRNQKRKKYNSMGGNNPSAHSAATQRGVLFLFWPFGEF